MNLSSRLIPRVPRLVTGRQCLRLNATRSYSTVAPAPDQEGSSAELSNYEKLRNDLKAAMRARDMNSLNPLKALITAHQASSKEILNKKPDTPTSHFESDLFLAPLIHKQIAKRLDSIAGFKEYHRDDLVEKETVEIAVLEKYLPQPQTTPEEVRAMTMEAIESLRENGDGANDPGSMSHRRIFQWLNNDEGRRQKLSTIMVDQSMFKRVVAETVRELSDRVDSMPSIEVEKLKPKEEDTLTKDRY